MATNILVCLVLFAAASAVPLVRDDLDSQSDFFNYKCARQCKGSPFKFDYQKDTTYIYKYQAEVDTSVAGASEDKATMFIQTKALIEVLDQCEFALRLDDISVLHSEPYSHSLKPAENINEFRSALTSNTLRFSFDDGIIRDICHPSQEKIWVLNFKRGLLSAFQNSMDNFKKDQMIKEIDVTGDCHANYTKKKEWIWERTIKVSKTKNLLACYQHSGFRTIVPMVPYRVPSDIQSPPIMKSSHECDFVVSRSRILKSAVCEENHVFAPFSNHQSGGSTVVRQTLEFLSTKPGVETREGRIDVRSNLLFKHLNGIDAVQNSRRVAEQKFRELCDQTKMDIRAETPRLFDEIVRSVKDMDSGDLNNLYDTIKNKRFCRKNDKVMKFFLDSLPIAGTKGALELMVTVMTTDEIPEMEKKVWLTSLSLIPEPSEDMLPSIMKLLSGDYRNDALLPVSALLNTMCRKNVNCDRSSLFKEVVDKISGDFDGSLSSGVRDKIMIKLRAIGNIGYGKGFLKTLRTCLRSRYTPLEVKVAAADAYRRFKCQDDEESGVLMKILEDKDADSELRIMSFLSLMRCPRDAVLQKISAQLDKEEDVHVGTFIYSHLENLKETSDPHKQDIAEAVKRMDLKPFEDSGFKTSRSHEFSTLINRFNLGYVANGDLIWSQSSMVPRAMRVNLTVEMFGNSINLFEAGARVDGFDRFIQKYFGTEGYFSHSQASPEDLEAFIYARVFGNELFFKHMKGTEEYEKVKSYLNFDKMLEKMSKKFDMKYTHSQQLMDQSMIIPTAVGLPVNMTMNSTVVVDAETKGKIDFSGILSRSKPITVMSDIAASAGVEVTGSMMVDAMLYKQGVRMRNTLHSSVNFKANLMIKNRQIVDFEIDSPQEKQELFDARSQFFIIHDNYEKEQEMIKENRREMQGCTGDKFAKVTGIELCGELQYPNASMVNDAPYFPLTGPARATLVMNKKDTHRSYKIFAKWVKNSKKLEAQLQLDTPGSRTDRHISADVTIGVHKNPHVDMVLLSPWKKIVFNGKAAKNKDLASLTGSVAVDNNKEYKLTSEVKIKEVKQGTEYQPYAEIERDSEKITLLKGTVSHTESLRAKLDVQDLKRKQYTIESNLINDPGEKRIDVSAGKKGENPYRVSLGAKVPDRKGRNIQFHPEILIQAPKVEIISWKAYGEFQPKPMKVVGNMTFYTDLLRMKRPLTLKVDVNQRRQNYPVSIELKSSMISSSLKGHVEIGKSSHQIEMEAKYKTRSMKDTINFVGKLQDKSKTTYRWYKMKSSLKFKSMPEYNSICTLDVSHKKKTTVKLNVQFTGRPKTKKGQQPDIRVIASLSTDIKKLQKAEIEADLRAKMPEKDVDIKMEFKHKHRADKLQLDSEVKLHLSPILKNDINADISVKDKGRSLFDITANGNVEAGGRKYSLKSEFLQKSKGRYMNSIAITDDKREKHSVVTVFKKTDDNYEINVDIDSPRLDEPLGLQVSADLKKPTDFYIRGVLNENDNELCYLEALSKVEGGKAGRWNLELAYPQRKVKAKADFTKVKNRIDADAMVNWDVRSQEKPKPEVRVTGQFTRVSEPDSMSLKGNVKVTTPFKDFEKLSSNWNMEKSKSEFKSTAKFNFDENGDPIFAKLTAKLPISINNAEAFFQAKTTFKNYRDIVVDLDHKFDSEIETHLKAKLNKDKSEMIIKGKKDDKDNSRRIRGEITLNTPYQPLRHVFMSVEHFDDEKEFKTSAKINKDGEKYSADLHLSRDTKRAISERSGQLHLSGPERSAKASFLYKIQKGKHQLDASFDCAQNNRKNKYSVDIVGSYFDLAHHSLNIDMKTPWKKARKMELEIDNDIERAQVKSKAIFQMSHSKVGYNLDLDNKPKDKSAEVHLYMSLLRERDHGLHLKSKLQFDNFPMTVSGLVAWDSSSVVSFIGSYQAQSLDDLVISLKVTTPFENLKNIDVVASTVLKNSERVSHLNVDYGVRKAIDVEVRSRNEDERKGVRFEIHIPSSYFQSLDAGVSIDLNKGMFSKTDFELHLTPEEAYEGKMSLKVKDIDDMRLKVNIKTPIEGLEHIECMFVRDSRNSNKENSLALVNGGEKLIDIKAETEVKREYVNIKIVSQGKLLPLILESVDKLRLLPKMHKDAEGNEVQRLISEVKIKEKENTVQIDGSLTADYSKSQQTSSASLRVAGDYESNIDIHGTITQGEYTIQGNFVLQMTEGFMLRALVTDIFGGKHGIEYSHSGDSYKATAYCHELRMFESSVELFISSSQRIEFVSSTKTDIKGYELTKLKYIQESKDNRVSCSLSMEDVKRVRASIDLVGQTSPIHVYSLVVKTPYKHLEELVVSCDYDATKFNGLFELNEGNKLSLSGVHDNWKNPRFTLKTPFRQLQDISVNMDGKLRDGSTSFTLKFNDNDEIDGNFAVRYDAPSEMEVTGQLKSKIEESENTMKLEVKTEEQPTRTHVLLAVNDKNRIKYESRMEDGLSYDKTKRFTVEVRYPSLNMQTRGLVLNLEEREQKYTGNIEMLGQSKKVIDADIEVDFKNEMKASLVVREPKHMEYRFTRENFPKSNENELYFNWDRDDPSASLVIKATHKDESTSDKIDNSVSLRLSCPRRSIGLEHSIKATWSKVQCAGKIYWNDDRESRLAYQLELKDQSNRRRTSYDGELKAKLPMRTIGFYGYVSDKSDESEAKTTFSWDMDKDASKRIGVEAKLQKKPHTQAYVSLILPKDAHVDSKLLMNKGNTILEGETQIFYSDDSRKTLTFFSKLEKNPEYSRFSYHSEDKYNYSIQLGLSHPDSRVDVKMASHLAMDTERLTSSVGIDYLTSRRQKKNMDLFVEINRLKNEINLRATTPYKNLGLTGAISSDPMELRATTTIDDQQALSARLSLDPDQKKVQFDYTNGNKDLRYSAGFPNKTALLLLREKRVDGHSEQDTKLLVQLATPYLLKTDLRWKPGMLAAIRDRIFQIVKENTNELKSLSEEIARDVKKEAHAKYKDVTASLIDDIKHIVVSVEQEIASWENELDQIKRNLHGDFDFCPVKIGDFNLDKEIERLQKKLENAMEDFAEIVKSYTKSQREMMRSLSDNLEDLKSLPFDNVYATIIREIGWAEGRIFNTHYWDFLKWLHDLRKECLEKIWNFLHEIVERQYDPRVLINDLNKAIEDLKNMDLASYITKMCQRNLQIASKLKIVIRELSKLFSENPITMKVVDILKKNVNDFYQLAKWSIDYLDIENNLPKQVDTVISYTNEIIEEELREKMRHVSRYIRNPITKFDSQQGVLQTEIPLIIPFDRLDQVPSVRQISEKVADYVQKQFGSNSSENPLSERPLEEYDQSRPTKAPYYGFFNF